MGETSRRRFCLYLRALATGGVPLSERRIGEGQTPHAVSAAIQGHPPAPGAGAKQPSSHSAVPGLGGNDANRVVIQVRQS